MTNEEFKEKWHSVNIQIRDLVHLKYQLMKDHIDEHTSGLIGKKVKCYKFYNNTRLYIGEGFVSGGEIRSWDGTLVYKINKIRKDGTMSGSFSGMVDINEVEVIE